MEATASYGPSAGHLAVVLQPDLDPVGEAALGDQLLHVVALLRGDVTPVACTPWCSAA